MNRNYTIRYVAISVLCLAFLFQACAEKPNPEEGCNFVQNSLQQRVSWEKDVPVIFYIHRSVPGPFFSAIELAIDEWNRKSGRELLKLGGWTNSGDRPKKDGANIVYWLDTWENDRPFEQARTTIYWSEDRIYEADIRVNAKNFNFFWGEDPVVGHVDVQSLLLHEFGHALGLAHTTNEQKSVMVTTLASATLRREAQDIDLRSLSCEY